MEILGIGWQELIFIVIIALIVLGPKDMQEAGRSLGRWLNQLVQSDGWKVFQKTSSELRNLPRNLMREANMEMKAAEKEIRRAMDPRLNPPPLTETENSIQPSDPTDTPSAVGSETNARDGSDEHVASK
jgi:sec-independent protein translocase protein TatB